ncbi:hypothetical protein [Jatrophihabitans fulvus]
MTPAPAPPASAALDVLRDLVRAYARRSDVATVAVVGNAPLPTSAERAAVIDGCDLVVRVNGFRTDTADEPPAVGTRTDVVVLTRGIRATPWIFRDYRDRLYLLAEPGRMHWEPEILPDWWPADLGQVPLPNREVVVPLSQQLGIDSVAEPRWATTGTLAAWTARALFPGAALHLAGHSAVELPTQLSWEHAYGEPCGIGVDHLIERESVLLRRWIADGDAVHHP